MARYRSVRNSRHKTPTICPQNRNNRLRAQKCGECPPPDALNHAVMTEDSPTIIVDFATDIPDGQVPSNIIASINGVETTIVVPYQATSGNQLTIEVTDPPADPDVLLQLAIQFGHCWLFAAGIVQAD